MDFILVIPGRGYPRSETRGDLIVQEEIAPRLGSVRTDIGVAQITIQQVEQRLHALHLRRVVARPY